jgi:hypothetical protein
MIDITVQNSRIVEIENKSYDPHMWEDLVNMIREIIDKSKYSGESMSLWEVENFGEGSMKKIVKYW